MADNSLLIYKYGKCCLFLTENLAFFVIGILVGSGSTQLYGRVVATET